MEKKTRGFQLNLLLLSSLSIKFAIIEQDIKKVAIAGALIEVYNIRTLGD
ncbi:MAG: hypothetical protein RSB59_06700 [Clostridia bacterium]